MSQAGEVLATLVCARNNQYLPAELKTRKIDVKLAPGLRVGYVWVRATLCPEAMEGMGIAPHILSNADLAGGDLSAYNVIVIGIRAYSVRPELEKAQPRLEEFVRNGGTLIVQYQSDNFPAPLPLSMGGRTPERVVDENAPVKLLDPSDPLLSFPNKITSADFDGWGGRARALLPRFVGPGLYRTYRNGRSRAGSATRRLAGDAPGQRNVYLCCIRAIPAAT